MSETICIPNIENYIQEIINGELVLTPKILKESSVDEFTKEQFARFIMLEYFYHSYRTEKYELELFENAENVENSERREFLRRQVGMIHQIKIELKKKFVEKYGEKLWDDMRCEYGVN